LKLSIIIPCYNEEHTINALLDTIFKVKFPIEREIIVIDDGSTVNHKQFVLNEIKDNKIKFVRIPENQGKGIAIRIGLKYASGDIFIIQDADLEYLPQDIPTLLKPILEGEAEVVYGTRFAKKPKFMARSHYLANKLLTTITNILYNTNLTDMETGYKLFTKNVLGKIELNTREFEFEPEITSKILLNGFKIKEIPINYQYRKHGAAKINWLDGIEGVLLLIQQRFCPSSIVYGFLYRIYKFHFKKVIFNLTKFMVNYIHMRRI